MKRRWPRRLYPLRHPGGWSNQRSYTRDDDAYIVVTDCAGEWEVEITTADHRTTLHYRPTRLGAYQCARTRRRAAMRRPTGRGLPGVLRDLRLGFRHACDDHPGIVLLVVALYVVALAWIMGSA